MDRTIYRVVVKSQSDKNVPQIIGFLGELKKGYFIAKNYKTRSAAKRAATMYMANNPYDVAWVEQGEWDD